MQFKENVSKLPVPRAYAIFSEFTLHFFTVLTNKCVTVLLITSASKKNILQHQFAEKCISLFSLSLFGFSLKSIHD